MPGWFFWFSFCILSFFLYMSEDIYNLKIFMAASFFKKKKTKCWLQDKPLWAFSSTPWTIDAPLKDDLCPLTAERWRWKISEELGILPGHWLMLFCHLSLFLLLMSILKVKSLCNCSCVFNSQPHPSPPVLVLNLTVWARGTGHTNFKVKSSWKP